MRTAEATHGDRLEQEVLATWVGRLGAGDGNGGAPTLELVTAHGAVGRAEVGAYTVIFDGVLHNRPELEQMLEPQPGLEDAALVAAACQRWGLGALDRIKGVFALVARDRRDGSALLARDPLGVVPLFYADCRGATLVSTSIDALLEDDGVSATLNRAALADHLCHRWPSREETYFEAIKRVPACHALVVERGTRRLHRYWDPAPPGEEMNWVGEDELERFHELFDQAVERCLELGPVGIFLSGGLDSVSVAGAAVELCRASGQPAPLALSVVFPHPECNEELEQKAVARDLGLDQVMLDLEDAVRPQGGLLMSACDAQAGRSAPMLNYYAAPYLQLAAEGKRRGCQTIITGNGGDEWLTVTPLYAADLIRSRDVKKLIAHARSIRRSFDLSTPRVWHNALWRFGMKPLLSVAMGSTLERRAPGLLRARRARLVRDGIPDWVAPHAGLRAEIERRGLEGWPARPTDGFYRDELRRGLDHAIVAMEMEENFENTRMTGVRTPAPFQDADLVDFLYRVPPELLDRGGRAKGLVRANLARRFPELGFERQKKISALSFYRGVALEQGESAWQQLGGVPALADLGVLDPNAFERELRSILAGREIEAFHVWDVLNLEAWTRSRI